MGDSGAIPGAVGVRKRFENVGVIVIISIKHCGPSHLHLAASTGTSRQPADPINSQPVSSSEDTPGVPILSRTARCGIGILGVSDH